MRAIGLFAAAAMLIGAAMGANAQNRSIETHPNSDYFGFDLRTERNLSLDQCSQTCIDDLQCRAFTYNERAQWCFLKSDYQQRNPFPGATAGRIVTAAAETEIGAPAPLAFVAGSLVDEARRFRTEVSGGDAPAGTVRSLTASGDEKLRMGDARGAAGDYRGALRLALDNAGLWAKLAEAIVGIEPANYSDRMTLQRQGTSAAYNGYLLTRTASQRAAALATLARALEKRELYRPAIQAYEASLEFGSDAGIAATLDALRERYGFRVVDNTIDSDTAAPRACIQFSEDLVKTGVNYADFVTLDGRPAPAVVPGERQLCVEGLQHGGRYRVVIRSGLPAAIGETIRNPVSLDLYVRDRTASIRFTGDSFVLPSAARRGVPLVSVNTDVADVAIYRVGERSLSRLVTSNDFLRQLDSYEIGNIRDDLGAPVWSGEIDIASELNKEITTSFPVDEALPSRQPGIYVLTASPKDSKAEDWNAKATQFFVVSDIGLTTYAGEDGLTVFARALSDAQVMPQVELTLLARNNEILGRATTDDEGKAVFTAGLTRGEAGQAPAVLLAKRGGDDFVFLDMTRAGFDLSDRGVTGRAAPGALDVFAWTERGIYRAGETVHAAALARDDTAKAVDALPLTFIFTRPDGAEDRRLVADSAALGGYAVDLPLQPNAMRGTWDLAIHADPKQPAIAETKFLVEDFVPDRIEFDLTTENEEIAIGDAAEVEVDGRFLYGAPASGLSLEGEVSVVTLREWDAFPGYRFGLADEEIDDYANVTQLEDLPVTDEDGKATLEVPVLSAPSTTRLLGAELTVRMREGAGRAVERKLDIGIRPESDMIGIRPDFSGGEVPEGSVAAFNVIGVDPDGERTALPDVSWELVRITRNYQWYRSGDNWQYEPVTFTTKVADGKLSLAADREGRISAPVEWGRYRLEVFSARGDGPASSVEFNAGWFVEATSTETPDGLEIALDRASYAPGETARLQISPRFAGEVLVTVGSERLLHSFTAAVPAEGATLDLPVSADWGAGAYVTATLYRPGNAQESRMPMRAIGVKWLSVDPGARKLDVKLETIAQTRPRQPLAIPVSVPGAAGERAYVAVAAVDVGILNLTAYKAPDPAGWYYGQRQLGLELRDLYGRLIDGSLGAAGRIRTGGDGGGMAIQGQPPKEKLVAFFEGPVELDAQGRATVAFDIPQFNGTVRVMAVAWTDDAVGSGQSDVIVREPVVVTAGLPRFMAPGDTAQLTLEIANTDGPAGDYALTVETHGGVEATAEETVALDAGQRRTVTVPLVAATTGTAGISVRLAHAGGTEITHDLSLPVRPGAMPITTRRVVNLAAGQSLRVDDGLLADSLLDGASVSIGVTPIAAFDIPSLLMSLDRYPYGCAEQTTSRALPLLYVSELSAQSGLDVDPDLRKRVQDSIARILGFQSSSGSFGLWAPGYGDLWLDAYVSDFLTRAQEQNYTVPAEGMRLALDNLSNQIAYNTDIAARGREVAYALYVLARNRRASAGDLRYYVDTRLDEFATPMARAQLGASLALYGDNVRAEKAFASALEQARTADASLNRNDYGSKLRDGAAMLALAAETRPLPGLVPEMISYAASAEKDSRTMSTQEQAWMLLAARALADQGAAMKLEIDGAAHDGAWSKRLEGTAVAASPVSIANRGTGPVDAVVTTVALPADPLPAGGDGFTIAREYYTVDGEPANISEAVQNERYVVVITATEENAWPSRVLVTDLLPAGFEIDNPSIVSSAQLANFDWLEPTEVAHTEFRDDRFVAAFDRTADSAREMTLAYVVRAVTPGAYVHPAAQIEDMYRPQFSARTSVGAMEVMEQR